MTDHNSTSISSGVLSSVLKEQFENFTQKDLGVARSILNELKPLMKAPQVIVITGLRRVGKSTLLAQIAEKFFKNNYYIVNFEDERLLNFQVSDFDLLYETLISLFGIKKVFLFDEIQNVPQWERFIRRLHDQGFKFVLTGSNASLLSQELGTRLTGRSVRIELYPFSFSEYLNYKKIEIPDLHVLTTAQKGKLRKLQNEYLISGGIPDALKYPQLEIHKTLYDDVLYRDIATRYKLENIKSLKELALYLLSNTTSLISFNKLKELLKLGSVNTVKSYIDYLENSWLFFILNKYAYSVKEQQIASKKVYSIDNGLVTSIGFSFSPNVGKLMENIVYVELKRRQKQLYYYKTSQNSEVDFFNPKERIFIQVCKQLEVPTREREIKALFEASLEQPNSHLSIITENSKELIEYNGVKIQAIPLYEWLLKI